MKRIICLMLALVMASFALVSCDAKMPYEVTEEETDIVIIDVKDYGKIVVELDPEQAPETVANFKKLVSEGFYDGIIFHRVIKDFMIQGGDPKGTGTGGSDENIKGEFTANGVNNTISHKRGVISMARQGASANPDDPKGYNTASSQFFIVHKDSEFLDGQYAAFGMTVYGLEVVDKIAAVRTNSNDKPIENVTIKSIKFAVEK